MDHLPVNMTTPLDLAPLTDRQLIARHLDGDRDAFRQIVERHQEVFLAAWKQLPELREPEKLRGWLAGITRHLINNTFRRQQRTPTDRAEELSAELPSEGNSPSEHAISVDEASLMWHALASIPENYREPMVLFYREHRSIPAVAAVLEISEEAVRQRLVRGRAMLTERMAKLVEETLERSAPTPVFAGAVMMAMPLGVTSTVIVAEAGIAGTKAAAGSFVSKTATAASVVGMAASKGGLAVKALSVVGLLPVLLGSLMEFLKFRANYDAADSATQRRGIVVTKLTPAIFGALLAFAYVMTNGLCYSAWGGTLGAYSRVLWVGFLIASLGIPFVGMVWIGRWLKRVNGTRGVEGAITELQPAERMNSFEYLSRRKLLGLPLLHVHVGGSRAVMRRTARGWIAVSDGIALGGFFACGTQLAVAPLSMGCCAFGLLSVGCLSVGGAAAGLFAAGVISVGGYAVGLLAAKGGIVAAAEIYAKGYYVFALHGNDAAAVAFFDNHLFYQFADRMWQVVLATVWFMWLPSLLLVGWHLWRSRAAR